MNGASFVFVPLIVGARIISASKAGGLVLFGTSPPAASAISGADVFSRVATALYIVGLIVILLALTDGKPNVKRECACSCWNDG